MSAFLSMLTNLRGRIGGSILWVAPVIAIVILSAADLVFFSSSIAPNLDSRAQLAAQLEAVQGQLAQVKSFSNDTPGSMQKRVADARATLTAMTGSLLDGSQRSNLLNALYQNAQVSGVTITQLNDLTGATPAAAGSPTPTAKPPTPIPPTPRPTVAPTSTAAPGQPTSTPAPAQPTPLPLPPAQPVAPTPTPKSLFNTTTLRLQAQGDPRRLLNFLARFRDFPAGAFSLSDFSLTGTATTGTLTFDLTLYFAAGIPQPKPTPTK